MNMMKDMMDLKLSASNLEKFQVQRRKVYHIDTPFKREKDGKLIVMNRYGGEVFEVNEVGRLVLNCIADKLDFQGILAALRQTFAGVSDDQLLADLMEYIDYLMEYCIIAGGESNETDN